MEFVLADANPAAVITSADLRSRVDGRGLLVVDVADPALAAQPATALPAPSADSLAYMIYTSGTTGKPKGVAIAHYTVTWLVESLDAGLPRAGVDAVPFVGVRLLGGDLRRALLRGRRLLVVPEEVAGLAGGLPHPAGRRRGQRPDPDPVVGGHALPGRPGVDDAGRRR